MSYYGGRCGECLFSSKIGTKCLKDGIQDICEAKESNLRPVKLLACKAKIIKRKLILSST